MTPADFTPVTPEAAAGFLDAALFDGAPADERLLDAWATIVAQGDALAAEQAKVARVGAAQRIRNHEKWGELSIENRPPDYRGWLPTLGEEYGEVCRALTLEQGDPGRLRSELIDVAAVALMWLVSIDRGALAEQPEQARS